MKLYHGTDNASLKIKPVKDGYGYHPGAGPVEFLGPSFTDSMEVALSYGKFVFEYDITPKHPKKYKSLKALKEDMLKTFALQSGHNLGEQYRDIADSYKIKLQYEGFDSVMFPEGVKTATDENIATTIIPLEESLFLSE